MFFCFVFFFLIHSLIHSFVRWFLFSFSRSFYHLFFFTFFFASLFVFLFPFPLCFRPFSLFLVSSFFLSLFLSFFLACLSLFCFLVLFFLSGFLLLDSLVGLVVRRPPRERVRIPLARDFFRGRVNLAFQWLPCQAPSVTGSALGLVGSVSVDCDWVS